MHFHVRLRDVDGDREIWVTGDQMYRLIAARLAGEMLDAQAASTAAVNAQLDTEQDTRKRKAPKAKKK